VRWTQRSEDAGKQKRIERGTQAGGAGVTVKGSAYPPVATVHLPHLSQTEGGPAGESDRCEERDVEDVSESGPEHRGWRPSVWRLFRCLGGMYGSTNCAGAWL
jgi:hypothetical protein